MRGYIILFSALISLSFSASGNGTNASKPSKLDSYHKWLQGDWGQMSKDGVVVVMRGCALESTTPDPLYNGHLKSKYDLNIGYFYHGVISFGIMHENLHVISNYTADDFMFKKAVNNFRRSSHEKLTLIPGVDKKGFVTFNFDKDIPGLANLYTIVPLTNNSFKLVTKADDTNTALPAYYFTRCDNS